MTAERLLRRACLGAGLLTMTVALGAIAGCGGSDSTNMAPPPAPASAPPPAATGPDAKADNSGSSAARDSTIIGTN